MQTIVMEEKIMAKTFSIIFLFEALFTVVNIFILCTILATILSFALEWIFVINFSILLLLGIFLVIHVVIVHFRYLQVRPEPPARYLPVIAILITSTFRYRLLIDLGSLYTAQGEATKCLDLLRLETLNDPAKKYYSCTLGSCTAILRFGPNVDVTNNSIVEEWINRLAEHVAQPSFIGTSRFSSTNSAGFDAYVGLHCTNSWGGIAQWIAKRQLRNSTQEELASSDTTPLLR